MAVTIHSSDDIRQRQCPPSAPLRLVLRVLVKTPHAEWHPNPTFGWSLRPRGGPGAALLPEQRHGPFRGRPVLRLSSPVPSEPRRGDGPSPHCRRRVGAHTVLPATCGSQGPSTAALSGGFGGLRRVTGALFLVPLSPSRFPGGFLSLHMEPISFPGYLFPSSRCASHSGNINGACHLEALSRGGLGSNSSKPSMVNGVQWEPLPLPPDPSSGTQPTGWGISSG